MLAGVANEALKRISGTRAVLRMLQAYEPPHGQGDVASRTGKGMLFVQNYATYEYVIVSAVRALITDLNARKLQFHAIRAEVLAMALDPEFTSLASTAVNKSWRGRARLVDRARCAEAVAIRDNLFPGDGSHFKVSQLETIWRLFCLRGEVVPEPRLRGHIEEMVEKRNIIAHGGEAPDVVGGGFSVADMEKRLADTETICSHIIGTVTSHTADHAAFR